MKEQNKLSKEIDIPLFEQMMQELENSSELKKDGYSLLVHGQGSQTRSFYRRLNSNTDLELLWTGWSGPKILWILSFIPGQAGLLRIKNIKRTRKIFEEVGIHSLCGLYFVPEEKEKEIIEGIKQYGYKFDIYSIFKPTEEYFLLDIDFDYYGGTRDGEIYFMVLNYGNGLTDGLKNILRRTIIKSSHNNAN